MMRLLLTVGMIGCLAWGTVALGQQAPQPRYPEGEQAGRDYDFTHPTKPWRLDTGTEGWRRREQLLETNPFYYIWWESATKKVPRFFPQHTRNREVREIKTEQNAIALNGVRGEKVSFQIAVSRRREQHVHIKSLNTRGLSGPEDGQIPAERIALNQVGFIDTVYPDVLFPMPLGQPEFQKVPYGENSIFWITIDIPRDLTPGTYEGEIRLTIDPIGDGAAGGRHELPVRLEVSPVTLPKRTNVQTMNVRLYGGANSAYDQSARQMPDFIADQFFPILAENRMSNEYPQPLTGRYVSRATGEKWDWLSDRGVETWEKWAHWWDDQGLYIGRIPLSEKKANASYIRRWNKRYGQIIRENNWEDRTHVLIHNADLGRQFTEIAPEIRVANNSSGEIWGAFNAWYEQDAQALQAKIDKWLKRRDAWIDIYNERPRFSLNTVPRWGQMLAKKQAGGDQRAWYWHNQSPVTLPALGLRDFFWRMFRNDVSATLYWGSVMWHARSESTTLKGNERRVWRTDRGFAANRITGADVGNGVLFWPGREEVLSSMRLEIYRDGVEDFDLLTLLNTRTDQLESEGGHGDLVKRAKQALKIPDDLLLPTLKVYPVNEPLRSGPHTPSIKHQQAFEQHRRRIVQTLEQVNEALGDTKQ